MEKSDQKLYALKQAAGGSDDNIYKGVVNILTGIIDLNRKLTLADIGCGKGEFLSVVNKLYTNIKLLGCDLYDYSKSIPKEASWYQMNLDEDNTDKIGQHDIVTAIEVIEHLENPRSFIKLYSQNIKPGGYLILTTPNIESITSIFSFIFRGYHSAFGPKSYPAHITPIAAYDLNNMIKETEGLNLVSHYYIPNGRIPGLGLKWHKILPFLSGKRFSDNYITIIKKS